MTERLTAILPQAGVVIRKQHGLLWEPAKLHKAAKGGGSKRHGHRRHQRDKVADGTVPESSLLALPHSSLCIAGLAPGTFFLTPGQELGRVHPESQPTDSGKNEHCHRTCDRAGLSSKPPAHPIYGRRRQIGARAAPQGRIAELVMYNGYA